MTGQSGRVYSQGMANYRFIGTTDDTTTCDQCGKAELRSTIILALLDADGNVAETVYYGSTCAARALTARTGRRHTGAKVLDEARAAQRLRESADREARALLAYYGLPLQGPATAEQIASAAILYRTAHRAAVWAPGTSLRGWVEKVHSMISRCQAQVI